MPSYIVCGKIFHSHFACHRTSFAMTIFSHSFHVDCCSCVCACGGDAICMTFRILMFGWTVDRFKRQTARIKHLRLRSPSDISALWSVLWRQLYQTRMHKREPSSRVMAALVRQIPSGNSNWSERDPMTQCKSLIERHESYTHSHTHTKLSS